MMGEGDDAGWPCKSPWANQVLTGRSLSKPCSILLPKLIIVVYNFEVDANEPTTETRVAVPINGE